MSKYAAIAGNALADCLSGKDTPCNAENKEDQQIAAIKNEIAHLRRKISKETDPNKKRAMIEALRKLKAKSEGDITKLTEKRTQDVVRGNVPIGTKDIKLIERVMQQRVMAVVNSDAANMIDTDSGKSVHIRDAFARYEKLKRQYKVEKNPAKKQQIKSQTNWFVYSISALGKITVE